MDMDQPGFRDAIHVPFVMVTCDTDLQPGDKISFRRDGDVCIRWAGPSMDWHLDWHGVADPFVEGQIPKGQLFRAMIRKEFYANLRHVFELTAPTIATRFVTLIAMQIRSFLRTE